MLCGALAPLPIVVRRAGDALLIEVRHEDQPPKILQRPVTEVLSSSLRRVEQSVREKERGSRIIQSHASCLIRTASG